MESWNTGILENLRCKQETLLSPALLNPCVYGNRIQDSP
jgi:hypothetical protein